MADNTVLPTSDAGGDTLHTDDLTAGTYKMATSKVIFGASGNNDAYWAAGAGAVGVDVGRVTLASDDPAVTALQLIDNAVSGAGFNVTQFAGVGISMGTGVRDAGTQRVTIATDDAVPVTGTFFQATQPVSGTVAATQSATWNIDTVSNVTTVAAVTAITNALPAGTNAIGKLAANSGVDIGDVDILSVAAGTNLIGDVGLQPRTTGGLTMSKTTSAASTNATSVKASAGQVYSLQCFNVNAAVRYLKLYNKASAPTVGTDTPVKTLAIPGNTAGAGFVISWPQGIAFGTGIAFALTTEATDAGTTGVAANEITVNLDYN